MGLTVGERPAMGAGASGACRADRRLGPMPVTRAWACDCVRLTFDATSGAFGAYT